MNEFEWRRQLRDLRQPITPQRDLWASIDAVLDDAERSGESEPALRQPRHSRRWSMAVGVAASALLVGGLGWHLLQVQAPTATPVASSKTDPARWKPTDPRLAGAAVELDAAQMELHLAIQQAPDSQALQRLLDRTELQQTQLRQLAKRAG